MSSAPANAALLLTLPASEQMLSPEEEVLQLFDSSRDGLLRYALSFGISLHDAEDVVQEMFLALFRHVRGGGSRANLQGWAFRVTHNLALKRRMRVHTEIKRNEDDVILAEKHPDSAPTPERHVLLEEQQQRLLAV